MEVGEAYPKEEAFSCADTREDREQFAAFQGQAKRALEILDAHCPAKNPCLPLWKAASL